MNEFTSPRPKPPPVHATEKDSSENGCGIEKPVSGLSGPWRASSRIDRIG